MRNDILDVTGFRVGQMTDEAHRTGCTVILCPPGGAVGGVNVMGGAPGTRETDLLDPGCTVDRVNAVLLSGGSAFGLDAASGVMRYLEEQGEGVDVGVTHVPIVPAAVIFDLSYGDSHVRPDAAMGYEACRRASSTELKLGAHGAGTGATVGKVLGMEHAARSGIGSASMMLPGGGTIAALVVVNALGNVVDPATGEIIAGVTVKGEKLDATALMLSPAADLQAGKNTTIGCVVTDVKLTKAQANRLATTAHDGLARAIRPVHTTMDGDTLFTLSAGEAKEDFAIRCVAAAEVVARAVLSAVTA